MWGVRKASSHQRNIGILPRCPSHSRSLLWARSRIWGMRQSCDEPPNCHCARLPLFPCSFLSEPNEGTPVLWRCPPPSQLSFHWLHMKNNETSSETRLQKKKGGGGGIVLKEWEIVELKKKKKAEGVCLLSVAVIFGEVCRSAFFASIGGAG